MQKRNIAKLKVGTVLVTTAGVPEFEKWLIHGVPPIMDQITKDEMIYEKLLQCLIINVLNESQKLDCSSIAVPNLSEKLSKFPKEKGCKTVLETCARWVAKNQSAKLRKIYLCAKNDKDYLLW